VIVGIIRRKPVLTYASIISGGMLASVNSVNLVNLVTGDRTARVIIRPVRRLPVGLITDHAVPSSVPAFCHLLV